MTTTLEQLFARRLIPVVKLDQATQAAPLADALAAAGLPILEITFRTDCAADAIASISSRPDVLVGAGTIVTPDQAQAALDAGATFLVSPGLDEEVLGIAHAANVPILPGVATPTEITRAIRLGLDTLKFFPAGAMGGHATLKALAAPFPNLRFVPTGGVHINNMNNYLALKCVPACGGSWMVPPDALASGDYGRITTLTTKALAALD